MLFVVFMSFLCRVNKLSISKRKIFLNIANSLILRFKPTHYKMKNLLFSVLAICFFATSVTAQTPDSTSWAYAELLGYKKFLSTKVNVEVDYGQSSNIFQNDMIVSADGKPISFNSMVDAMNFMGKLGWEFVQAVVITEGNQNIYHWILKREVKFDSNGGFVPLTRKEFKKANGGRL